MIPRYNRHPLTGSFVLSVQPERPAPSKYYIQRIRKDLEENPAKMIGVGRLHENLQAVRNKRARELRMVREASSKHRPRNENWIYIETDGLTYHGSLETLERMTVAIKNSFGDQLERFKEYP